MTRKTEDIFNNCLEQMFEGRNIEDCLNAYPKQAPELESLLQTSLALAQRSSAIQPAPEFKEQVHLQLQAMLYAKQKEKERARIPVWYRRWALATAAVLGFLLIGIGTVGAAASTLPDATLYPVKLAAEQVKVTLAFSDMDKAKMHIQCAERRADEMVQVARQGKSDKITMLNGQIANHLDKIPVIEEMPVVEQSGAKKAQVPATAVAPTLPAPAPSVGVEAFGEGKEDGELEEMLSQSRAENLKALRNALDKAPEKLKPVLRQAIENMEDDYNKTISIIESGANQ